jgi:type IV pilus assembly protein PilN
MRININLASNPYEVARQYTRRLGALVVALVVLTIGLIAYIFYQRSQTREVNQRIRSAQQEIANLDNERATAVTVLNQPQNRDVADQSQFLNNLFVRKSLSWTKVFTEMERLMPPNIHVISMKPEFDRDNQLVLHVVVVTSTRDTAVELVKRMEKSAHFRSAQVEAENAIGQGLSGPAAGNIQFDIAAVYLPFADDNEASADENTEKTEKSTPVSKPAAKSQVLRPVARNRTPNTAGAR